VLTQSAFVVTSSRLIASTQVAKVREMLRSGKLFVAAQLAVFLLLASSAAQGQTSSPLSSDISYTVAMSKPWTHLLEVEVRIKVPANLQVPNESNLILPVWTPGSYMVREFERHVQDFAADVNGRALEWTKVNKDT